MSTVIGGLSYLGVPEYQEVSGAELPIDYYGADRLTRKYEVRPDSIALFRNKFVKGFQDTVYPGLYVTKVNLGDVVGVMCPATVIFDGALIPLNTSPNAIRKLRITGGQALQQVALRSLLTPDAERNVSYWAPWTEYKYITIVPPSNQAPQFAGQLIQNQKVARVVSTTGAFGVTRIDNSKIVQQGQTPQKPVGEFQGLLKVNQTKFDPQQNGSVWEVTERNELIVVDWLTFALNNFGW